MTRVHLDETILSQLRNLSEPIELIDETGRVLGRIVPVRSHLSKDELQRRENEEDYPIPDVLAYVKKL